MKRPVYIKTIFLYYPLMPFTLYRYLAREVLSAFLLGLVIFTGVLLMGRMLKLADMVVSKGVPLTDLLLMIVYLLPNFAIITIPMSLLFAVLLAFSRLSGDSEIIAIKASGISLYRILPPILAISLAAYLLTALTAVYALPKGSTAFKELLYQSIQGRLSLNLKEQVFNSDIPDLLIYITKNSGQSGILSGVMIQDERNPKEISTIFAETGSVAMDETSKRLNLHLRDGTIHQSRPKENYRLLGFKEYDLAIDLSKTAADFDKNELDMTLSEIRQNLKKGGFSKKLMTDMNLEVHRRFAMPFACFIFAIIAVPLGIQNRRSGKAAGFSLSIATLLIFYIFQSAGKSLAEKGLLTHFMAAWLPNFIFLAAGAYFFIITANEKRFAIFDRIAAALSQLFKKARPV
jgi:lipopolysaccharide export system permease protein